ncbi:glycosyltransferase family 4 protein [Microbacterium sp. Mu-80]|uniref:Glycosyltransferase family 4 protein n=1 Tax=Microbacterium bandirmense TaxID=3122050 RepID=A0ABU8LC26_9MICO
MIANGVDLERFRPPTPEQREAAREAEGVTADQSVALFIGHEFERKGLPVVLDALRQVPGVRLVVVGGTAAMISDARRRAARAGVADRVRFAGQLDDPLSTLHAADCFVLPSAYEANALVVLEALACGVPVVATPVGAAPDLLTDGVNGAIVRRNPDSVAAGISRVGMPDATMRTAARAVAEKHSWSNVAQSYLTLAESLRGDERPLSIVHAIRSDGFSGVERFIARLAVAQLTAGARVRVIGGDPDRMRAALGSGIAYAPARTTLDVMRALRVLPADVDVVNTHMTAADTAAVAAFGWRRARPAVVSTRHFARPRRRGMDRLIGTTVDAEVLISNAVAAASGSAGTVVHTGIADLPGTPGGERSRIVLVAQRLQPEKATDVAIRAFASSGLADAGWSMQIAGDGPEHSGLEAFTQQLGVAHAIDFLGHRADVTELMTTAGLLLAPCPLEGLGLSVLEAMRCGLPVVAANAAGHIDLLGGLDERALFRPGDAEDAARCLRALADDPAGREQLAIDARQRQLTSFSIDAQVTGTDAVYRNATRRRLTSNLHSIALTTDERSSLPQQGSSPDARRRRSTG